ncbi:MAG TPA: tetratricopeptide repeat protein [Methylomirabilota bacterium]|nr:tetratricopeptide repeat protein [Methylomirabilota bacterium]
MTPQERYDDAMFDFSTGEYDRAIEKLTSIIAEDPSNFEAQLSLGMSYYRKGDFAKAIEEGHKAEKMRPNEQFVHTNLSLFYMKAGDKKTAEHHGLQARIAAWKDPGSAVVPVTASDPELEIAKPKAEPIKTSAVKFPEMPWKKNTRVGQGPKKTAE